jgi:hypothetical protein
MGSMNLYEIDWKFPFCQREMESPKGRPMLTASYCSPLGRSCKSIYDVLYIGRSHLLRGWVLVRPGNGDRPIN